MTFFPISKHLPMVLWVTEYDIIKLYSQFNGPTYCRASKDACKSFLHYYTRLPWMLDATIKRLWAIIPTEREFEEPQYKSYITFNGVLCRNSYLSDKVENWIRLMWIPSMLTTCAIIPHILCRKENLKKSHYPGLVHLCFTAHLPYIFHI